MSEEMENNVGEVPEAEAKAEGQKLEWGPKLGDITWEEALRKITEMNLGLSEGELSWRLPTQLDFEEALQNGLLDRSEYQKYWSINKGGENEPGGYFKFDSSGQGSGWEFRGDEKYSLRLVRDVA